MVYRTSLPIAQLRDMGCTVGAVLGHDPKRGYRIYRVTFPKGVDLRALQPKPAPGNVIVRPAYGTPRDLVYFHNVHHLDTAAGDAAMAAELSKAARHVAETQAQARLAEDLKRLGLK